MCQSLWLILKKEVNLFFKTESEQILRDKLCKFAQSNSHRDWFVFKDITSPLFSHQRATDICLNINIAKHPLCSCQPRPTWSRKGFHMGDLREFSTNQSFNEYILRSMWIRKSMKSMKRIWHLRWIIHIHLGKVNLVKFQAEEKEQPPSYGWRA